MPNVKVLCVIVEKVCLALKFIADQQQYAALADPRCWKSKQCTDHKAKKQKLKNLIRVQDTEL